MEISGRITEVLPVESGQTARGAWSRASIVVEYEGGQYPKCLILSNMRKAADFAQLRVGQTGTFKYDGAVRQAKNGRFYMELTCWDWIVNPAPPQQYGGYQQGPI